jgi:DNA-nicking Smr family endonuclease
VSKKKEKVAPAFAKLKELKKRMQEEEAAATTKPAPKRSVPPSPKKQSAAELESDAMSFHRLMSGVTPLDDKAMRIPKSQASLERSAGAAIAAKRQQAKSAIEEESDAVHDHLRTLVEGKQRFEVSDDGRRVEGRRLDLPPDALRRLRRGLLPIDARIDLHGHAAGEARKALEQFLRDKRARGERCVLVIHGKGEHSPHGMGILRGEIAAWLAQSAASEHVAAFATATEDDGGEGAIYVLLRR